MRDTLTKRIQRKCPNLIWCYNFRQPKDLPHRNSYPKSYSRKIWTDISNFRQEGRNFCPAKDFV